MRLCIDYLVAVSVSYHKLMMPILVVCCNGLIPCRRRRHSLTRLQAGYLVCRALYEGQ
ncbi:hypothetical protein BDV26DRAFT_269834 [Aspergillus bertholletiae]|uniref:Uncharacterized protein n=1 Tax=Aspergillus bertholletiae TaxID=1226010 RepID=A0A5N7AXB8_9EURO|nr:hypothetical protein BDV26DRAFT_269834 [Aspergillus bertholletiae]